MTPDEIKKYLRAEWSLYDRLTHNTVSVMDMSGEAKESAIKALESLAEARRLLKKHEWSVKGSWYVCPECNAFETDLSKHKPNCALAKAVEGVGE